MGCLRDNVISVTALAVGLTKVLVADIPKEVCEGQFTLYNSGLTTIYVHVANRRPTLTDAYCKLIPDATYTEDGIIPGEMSAISDAAGGVLEMNASFSLKGR